MRRIRYSLLTLLLCVLFLASVQAIWVRQPWICVREYDCPTPTVGLSPNGDEFFTMYNSCPLLNIWNARTGEVIETLGNFHGEIASAFYSPTGRFLTVRCRNPGGSELEFDLIRPGTVRSPQYPEKYRANQLLEGLKIFNLESHECESTIP